MGVTNIFAKAQELVQKELLFSIDGEASDFRAALDRAGIKRLEHCVVLVKMWARPGVHGVAKYERLMKLLRLVTPEKVGKYRNADAEAGAELHRTMDAEMMAAIGRDK